MNKDFPRVNIYVDGWCKNNPGQGGWRCLVETKEITRRGLDYTTNNICEYFAIIDAIQYIKKQNKNINWTIWSDSQTAISWFNNKKVKTKIKNDKIIELVKKTENYLINLELKNYIVKKWNTKKLGEIPADFGRKK